MSSPDHSTSNNEDAFSSNIPDYVSTISDYSPASLGKTYSNASNNSTGKIPLEFSPFYNMKDIQAFYAKELPMPSPDPITPPEISPKDTETSVSPSSSVGSSSPIRIPPKGTSTSKTSAITLATIQQFIIDGIAAALKTQAINTNRTLEPRETPVAKRENYKEFISYQPFYFNGTKGTVDLIRWIEQANKITWTELKRLLTNKYCPQTEIKKIEDEFYDLAVKGSDPKTYIRRFQELATLCPNMVPNTKKFMEAFIGGLPRSIKGNVIALKPQTLKEAITIT
nr:reverse transcriptase domain-containing protein [Tanacetum cinerariifolium]